MRWMLSRTASSGSPTITVFGSRAGAVSTSTSTGTASMPSRAKVRSWASIEHLRCGVSVSVSVSERQNTASSEGGRRKNRHGSGLLTNTHTRTITPPLLLQLLLGPVVDREALDGEAGGADDRQHGERPEEGDERPRLHQQFLLGGVGDVRRVRL